jgi:IS5 family transposase
MTQHTFAIADFDRYAKTTRREIFFEEMDRVIPWGELISLIKPHYPNAENGRPAIALEKMLRIHLLQHWFGLSAPAAEEAKKQFMARARYASLRALIWERKCS